MQVCSLIFLQSSEVSLSEFHVSQLDYFRVPNKESIIFCWHVLLFGKDRVSDRLRNCRWIQRSRACLRAAENCVISGWNRFLNWDSNCFHYVCRLPCSFAFPTPARNGDSYACVKLLFTILATPVQDGIRMHVYIFCSLYLSCFLWSFVFDFWTKWSFLWSSGCTQFLQFSELSCIHTEKALIRHNNTHFPNDCLFVGCSVCGVHNENDLLR